MTNDIHLLYGACMATDTPREDPDERLGASVKFLRERARITQAELARQMAELGWPWHQSTTYRVESGRQPLKFAEAVDLATVLKTPLQWLTWGGPEVNEVASIDRSVASLRSSWREASDAVARLLVSRAGAEIALSTAQSSKYEQARQAAADLELELRTDTLEAAVADGIARYQFRETVDPSEPAGRLGPYKLGRDAEGNLAIYEIESEGDEDDEASEDAAIQETKGPRQDGI